jgi:alkaline phosphatase
VAVIGPETNNAVTKLDNGTLGTGRNGSGANQQSRNCIVTVIDGIGAAFPSANFMYENGTSIAGVNLAAAVDAVTRADLIIDCHSVVSVSRR